MSYNSIRERGKRMSDYYFGNRMNYYQKYDWKEKDLKTEEKLDELLAQTIKLSLQEGLRNEGNKR